MATPELKTYFQAFTADNLGQIQLTGILDIKPFNMVNLEIINYPNPLQNLRVVVYMGKITGETLAQEIDQFNLGSAATIRTYSVVGPELNIWIQGASPNAKVNIQAWVFLH